MAHTPAHGPLGNTMLQAVSNKEDPDKNRMLIEYSNDSIDHASLGFRFRTDPCGCRTDSDQHRG
jgi:hypothetical protein